MYIIPTCQTTPQNFNIITLKEAQISNEISLDCFNKKTYLLILIDEKLTLGYMRCYNTIRPHAYTYAVILSKTLVKSTYT